MDEANGRRETHDFMNVNVESFSQLPFIRRTPPAKEKGAIIRLFGKELVGDYTSDNDSSETTTTKNDDETSHENLKDREEKDKDKNSNNRRFECHYCFRNFPTSQALGGHQNAHKRERQHAKRGSMTSSYFHQPHDAHHHLYGFLNNRHYPSWTTESRFYGGQQHQHQTLSYYSRTLPPPPPPTINGSPMGLWRLPPSTSSTGVYSATAPAFRTTHEPEHSKDPNWPYRLMKPNVQDHMSLDLHL